MKAEEMKNEMRGASPEESSGAQYRLWSFVTGRFVIRAPRRSAFACIYSKRWARIDQHNLHGFVYWLSISTTCVVVLLIDLF